MNFLKIVSKSSFCFFHVGKLASNYGNIYGKNYKFFVIQWIKVREIKQALNSAHRLTWKIKNMVGWNNFSAQIFFIFLFILFILSKNSALLNAFGTALICTRCGFTVRSWISALCRFFARPRMPSRLGKSVKRFVYTRRTFWIKKWALFSVIWEFLLLINI